MFKQSSRLSKALASFTKLRDELLTLTRENNLEITSAKEHIANLESDNSTMEQILSSDFMKTLPSEKTK